MNEPTIKTLARRLDKMERENRWLKQAGVVALGVIVAVVLMGQARADVQYKIAREEDLSYRGIVRLVFRVQVAEPVTEAKLRAICKEIIAQQKRIKPHNAISFFFYLPGSDVRRFYTAGKGDWAPDGKWEKAGDVRTGDYSRHKLAIKVGGALGAVPESAKTALPEELRRKIFYDLVAAQDRGVGDFKAYEMIAKQYEVKVEVVKKIAIEGIKRGWPMP